MPSPQRRTASMARRSAWNIDAGIAIRCASNSEIDVLEIRLEHVVERADAVEQLGAEERGREGRKPDRTLVIPGRPVGTCGATAPSAGPAADGVPGAVEVGPPVGCDH